MYSLIDGKEVEGRGSDLTCYHPATGKIVEYKAVNDEAIETTSQIAVDAVGRDPFVKIPAALLRFSELLPERARDLASKLTDETGRHPKLINWEIKNIAAAAAHAAGLIKNTIFFQTQYGYGSRKPYGIVVIIEPSNFSTNSWWFAISALAAGNRVILKPSPKTPSPSLLIAKIAHEAGIPASWLQVVQADDEGTLRLCTYAANAVAMVAPQIVCHNVKRKVVELQKSGGYKDIPVFCEPNGISFAVVGEGTDLEKTADSLRAACSLNNGRVCFRPQVIYADSKIADQLADLMIQRTEGSKFLCMSLRDTESIKTQLNDSGIMPAWKNVCSKHVG